MLSYTKDTARNYLLREEGFIIKNGLKLHEEIFSKLYVELLEDKIQAYELDKFEDIYYEYLLDECEHDDYEIDSDEELTPNADGTYSAYEYRFAICKYCGKIGYPDYEGGFENWELQQ